MTTVTVCNRHILRGLRALAGWDAHVQLTVQVVRQSEHLWCECGKRAQWRISKQA